MRIKTFAAIAASVAVTGFLLAQGSTESDPNRYFEWQMFGANVTATAGDDDDDYRTTGPVTADGLVFIYNRRTGKVYRFFDNCGNGEDLKYGCFDDMPVLEGTMTGRTPRR